MCVSDNTRPLKSQKHVISLRSWAPTLCFCLLLSLCLFKPECGVLSVQPQLPAPRGSISRLHLFEGFLIWGLGQAKSTVPSSIIPAEEQRRGEEGVERRKRTGGDAVISYLSSLSPTCPIAATASIFAISHSPTHSALPPPSPLPRCFSIYRAFLSPRCFSPHLHSERQPVASGHPCVCLSTYLSV